MAYFYSSITGEGTNPLGVEIVIIKEESSKATDKMVLKIINNHYKNELDKVLGE